MIRCGLGVALLAASCALAASGSSGLAAALCLAAMAIFAWAIGGKSKPFN